MEGVKRLKHEDGIVWARVLEGEFLPWRSRHVKYDDDGWPWVDLQLDWKCESNGALVGRWYEWEITINHDNVAGYFWTLRHRGKTFRGGVEIDGKESGLEKAKQAAMRFLAKSV